MARYTGPKTKIARKFGEAIFGEDKSFEKKNYPPGQHGNNRRRGKKSEYAIQLMEKQTRLGKTVIFSIHQPSSDILKMFSRLFLMVRGNIVF